MRPALVVNCRHHVVSVRPPFSVANGFDRNIDAIAPVTVPTSATPRAPLDSRAVLTPASGSQFSATGCRNPDTGLCVARGDVHWVKGIGLPNAFTVGRNTLLAGGINNFDLSLSKSLEVGEQRRLEFRWEAQNAFNHPQYVNVPNRDVVNTVAGTF
jgi:hypothetical protein